ncbi:hypothetical protein [Janthinobacterium lividum]|uniref:hypothetical protein n=1 Tax=Janthinobacterium lividum TaxID=29581 RepID=UPI00140DEDE2|nr:hypothetical protein [Janthinobacterium lividum]NHQ91084.1 hypothetical protein [Janthinobacterium lividum]
MMRRMILLGAALSFWAVGNTYAADTQPMQAATYQAAPATPATRLASFQSQDANRRAPGSHEPGTHSLLLVAVMLLSLRMRTSTTTSSEKFST